MGSLITDDVATVLIRTGVHISKHTATSSRRPPLNAFIKRHRQQESNPESPLPKELRRIAVKDNISTADLRTTCASNFLKGYRPPFNASVVNTLIKAGTQVAGKTNMDEFGMGSHSTNSHYGRVSNASPYGSLSAGGSSGGSAAAIASGLVEAALGTDTGGSVRLPAAYTGVTGLKPSYGRISRNGVIPYANSLDTVGLLCKTPEHMSEFLYSSQSTDLRDPTSISYSAHKRMKRAIRTFEARSGRWAGTKSKPLRIGVPTEYNIAELSPAVRHTWQRTLDTLRRHGHTIIPVSLPSTKQALSAYYVLAAAEASSNLAKFDGVRYGSRSTTSDNPDGVLYAATRGAGFGDEVRRRILLGAYTLSATAMDNYFVQAQRVRRLVQRDFDRVFAMPNPLRPPQQFDLADLPEGTEMQSKLGPEEVDVLVVPTAPTLPPTLEEVSAQGALEGYMNDVFTVPASLAGLPAISVPVPIAEEAREEGNVGFVGMQVIGQYYDDYLVINVGRMVAAGEELPELQERLQREWDEREAERGKTLGYRKVNGVGIKKVAVGKEWPEIDERKVERGKQLGYRLRRVRIEG